MDQTQLELDLQAAEEKCVVRPSKKSAEIVSLVGARNAKKRRETAKLYEAILESVEHIASPDKQYK